MKRMMHPQHGFHHAYNTLEETAMRAAGWVDDEPVAAIAPVASADLVQSAVDAPAPVTPKPTRAPQQRKVKA